ncbi:MAG: hypothetical protein O7C75_20640 [Verrucomicrobia bacterium]|nr:hypothetical protein [Verrucomicrobiota bacterium]
MSFVEAAEPAQPMDDHACCADENAQNEADTHGAKDCPHKILLDEDARIAQDQGVQVPHSVAQADQVIALLDVSTLQNFHAREMPDHLSSAVIDSWIHTQTDCVRLL